MKNCIGKDLSKIPMPVNFSEPLSMLQRLAEDFEYTELLDKAATCTDAAEQLAYVAAFTVSSYATTSIRTAKPFNPLLGETFEFDRTDDKGWKVSREIDVCLNRVLISSLALGDLRASITSSPNGGSILRGSRLAMLARIYDVFKI